MAELTNEQRQEFSAAWAALDARDEAIAEARKPIDEQLRPFIEQSMRVEEEREALIEKFDAEFAGKCEHCGKPLFFGDKGSRPYDDESGIIYCAEHGMTYADLQQSWTDIPVSQDDDDQAESRKQALALVERHVAQGGALTDLIPPYTL